MRPWRHLRLGRFVPGGLAVSPGTGHGCDIVAVRTGTIAVLLRLAASDPEQAEVPPQARRDAAGAPAASADAGLAVLAGELTGPAGELAAQAGLASLQMRSSSW